MAMNLQRVGMDGIPRSSLTIDAPYEGLETNPEAQLQFRKNNVGALGPRLHLPSERVLSSDALNQYPSATSLESTLARDFGVDSDSVWVAAGADEVLDRAFRAFTSPGAKVLVSKPTFSMITRIWS